MDALLSLLLLVNVHDLDSLRHQAREQTQTAIAKKLTYPAVLLLEAWGGCSPESRRRVQQLISNYWTEPAWETCPQLDLLGWDGHRLHNNAVANAYLSVAIKPPWPPDAYGRYRLATCMFVRDLYKLRLPKPLITLLLSELWRRENEWWAARK